MKKLKTYFELEAGSITTKIERGELKFLIVHRVDMKDYIFPKGHVEEKESLEQTSIRETLEETGYTIEILDFIDSLEYKVKEEKYGQQAYIIRRVYYFLGKAVGEKVNTGNPCENEGATESIWMTSKDALDKLTYESDKGLVKSFLNNFSDIHDRK